MGIKVSSCNSEQTLAFIIVVVKVAALQQHQDRQNLIWLSADYPAHAHYILFYTQTIKYSWQEKTTN